MKKIISIILITVILTAFAIPTCADDEVDISEDSSNFSCTFDAQNNVIAIKGIIKHDVLVKYGDYTICIYKIPFNSTYQEAIKNTDNRVISNAPISIKFEYAIPVSAVEDRFASYALVLSSHFGNTYLASEMKIPSVENGYEYGGRSASAFKGIETNNIAQASNLSAGTAIIDVDLDSLYGNASNCYLYPMGDTFAYIDKAVISELDSEIMTLSQSKTRIYLRFLVLSEGSITAISHDIGDTEASYTIPDIYNHETLDFICATSAFLAERYDGEELGYINGVVLGTKADNVESVNYVGDISFDEYIERYTTYMLAVANSMRSFNPDLDIVVPISDANDYSSDAENRSDALCTELVEGIINYLASYFSEKPMFSLMLEIEKAPFNISNATLNNIIDTSPAKEHKKIINIENLEEFIGYFKTLSNRFDNAPQNYSVLWNVPNELSGNALSCAYSYSYYKLFSIDNKLSSFIVSFVNSADSENQRLDQISNIFREIDTENTFEVTDNILKYFGVTSWSKLLNVNSASSYAAGAYYEMELLNALPDDANGSFEYFDFSSASNISNWKNGVNTKNIKNEYSSGGVRALHINSRSIGRGASFETYYLYDSPESFAYTPYLVFDLNLDTSKNANEIFEVSVIIGNENATARASKAFAAGEGGQIILDIGNFSENNKAQYLKISIRALTDDAESVSVWLNSIKGYSVDYDDDELESVIKAERLRLQGDNEDSAKVKTGISATTVIWIVVVIVTLGIGIFVALRKEDDV